MGQLNKIYTKENAIPGNCHVQIYFTPTLEDGGGTARTLSETLGEKTIHSFSKSTSGEMFKGSTSTSNMARKLMTPDEVRRMPQDRELVFIAGFRAIYGYKLRYYEEPFFKKRIFPPPLFSDTATKIQSYQNLFDVHALERKKIEEKREKVASARKAREEKDKLVGKQQKSEEKVDAPKIDQPKTNDNAENPTISVQKEKHDGTEGAEASQPHCTETLSEKEKVRQLFRKACVRFEEEMRKRREEE